MNPVIISFIKEIERAKAEKKKGLFKFNYKISDADALAVKDYFEERADYDVEVRKCARCKGTWDILIFFK